MFKTEPQKANPWDWMWSAHEHGSKTVTKETRTFRGRNQWRLKHHTSDLCTPWKDEFKPTSLMHILAKSMSHKVSDEEGFNEFRAAQISHILDLKNPFEKQLLDDHLAGKPNELVTFRFKKNPGWWVIDITPTGVENLREQFV